MKSHIITQLAAADPEIANLSSTSVQYSSKVPYPTIFSPPPPPPQPIEPCRLHHHLKTQLPWTTPGASAQHKSQIVSAAIVTAIGRPPASEGKTASTRTGTDMDHIGAHIPTVGARTRTTRNPGGEIEIPETVTEPETETATATAHGIAISGASTTTNPPGENGPLPMISCNWPNLPKPPPSPGAPPRLLPSNQNQPSPVTPGWSPPPPPNTNPALPPPPLSPLHHPPMPQKSIKTSSTPTSAAPSTNTLSTPPPPTPSATAAPPGA